MNAVNDVSRSLPPWRPVGNPLRGWTAIVHATLIMDGYRPFRSATGRMDVDSEPASPATEPAGNAPTADRVRIDKWLWATRFFKTRALAAQAVSDGKVQVNGARIRSSRDLHPGDSLSIRRGPCEYVIVVRGLTKRRVPAVEAAQLYEETAESRAARERVAAERRARDGVAAPAHRPDKHQRHRLFRVIGRGSR